MESKMKIRNIVSGLFLCTACSITQANTITFDDAVSNAVLHINNIGSLSTGGLTFTDHGSNMGVWGPATTPGSNGTNSLIHAGFATGDYMAITKTGGGLFDLSSIDIAISFYDNNPSEIIYVNGTPITILPVMTTFILGLTGVSEVDITSVPSNTGYWALDNVVTSVPEPEAYALFMAGLGMMGFIARRRKNGQS
jgi:hypothetical protein